VLLHFLEFIVFPVDVKKPIVLVPSLALSLCVFNALREPLLAMLAAVLLRMRVVRWRFVIYSSHGEALAVNFRLQVTLGELEGRDALVVIPDKLLVFDDRG